MRLVPDFSFEFPSKSASINLIPNTLSQNFHKKFAKPEFLLTFAIRLRNIPTESSWRDGRVVDYGSLENC